jgi:hypothetical protein
VDAIEFKRIVTAFADTPAAIDLTKGELILQVQDTVIGAQVHLKEGLLYVDEGDGDIVGEQWIVRRLARLPLLADRILNYIPPEPNFVTPRALFLDQLEKAPTEQEIEVPNALEGVRDVLSERLGGSTSILYLTSDAGEGKTTLINQLARSQAEAYKEKKTDWLLLPITLGGRPFLRFDDVIVGALVNRFRFQFLYYETFVELVRLGVIVPAFDGFEEMFIESGTGEAVSALSNLLGRLRSAGNLLVSARKAYFEYKSFDTQAKLFDSLEAGAVTFSRIALRRWDREHFLAYAQRRKVRQPAELYDAVSRRFDTNHPLLTRAVLVRRLLDVVGESDLNELLNKLGDAPHDYFAQFVDAIIEREVSQKWIDRSGDAARPLITSNEHHALLSLLAREMWVTNTETLREDVLEMLAELFSEERQKGVVISRQIKERIKQHALLITPEPGKSLYAFDHEEFRNFFLGEALAKDLLAHSDSDVLIVLRSGPLPQPALDSACHFLAASKTKATAIVQSLVKICQSDGPASFTRENAGGLIIRLVDSLVIAGLTLANVTFPMSALDDRRLSGLLFEECYFQPTSLLRAQLSSCTFRRCVFERLELGNQKITNTELVDCQVHMVFGSGQDSPIFAPDEINSLLVQAGFKVNVTAAEVKHIEIDLEPALVRTERVLRTFLRATVVSENVLRLRLGQKANDFFDQDVAWLLKSGVLSEVPYKGSARQRMFKLDVPMQSIKHALTQCHGRFDTFLELINKSFVR